MKKGKNDLISAEEGEDPFADISSVGKSGKKKIFTHVHQQDTPDLYMLSIHKHDLYNKPPIKAHLLQ